jgi:hypothetical protein
MDNPDPILTIDNMPARDDAGTVPRPKTLPSIRGCDGCTLCCKVMAVRALAKPGGKWCPDCKSSFGCGIYLERPSECDNFQCGYLVMPHLTPEWKPAVSHLIITSEISEDRLSIHVDPARPDAWRRQPYYNVLKNWVRRSIAQRQQIVVVIGQRQIVLLPDRDVDLGVLAPEEIIAITETPSQGGIAYEVYAVRRDGGLGSQIADAKGKAIPLVGRPGEGFRKGKTLPL